KILAWPLLYVLFACTNQVPVAFSSGRFVSIPKRVLSSQRDLIDSSASLIISLASKPTLAKFLRPTFPPLPKIGLNIFRSILIIWLSKNCISPKEHSDRNFEILSDILYFVSDFCLSAQIGFGVFPSITG